MADRHRPPDPVRLESVSMHHSSPVTRPVAIALAILVFSPVALVPGVATAHMGESGPGHHRDDAVEKAPTGPDAAGSAPRSGMPAPAEASPAPEREAASTESDGGGIQPAHFAILGLVLVAGLGLLVIRGRREASA